MTTPKSVFVSYASEDAEVVRRICDALQAGGIEVWFDRAELRGGDAWDRHIRREILECTIFMPIISATTQHRPEGYFRREWKLAVDRTLDMSDRMAFLVPVVIDHTSNAEADVPDAFRAAQWTRLPAGETPPAFVSRILELLSPSQPPLGAGTRRPKGLASDSRPSSNGTAKSGLARIAVPLIAAVAVAAVGVATMNRHPFFKRTAAEAPATHPLPEKSIAVLPFVDMSEKKDQEYFSDGLSEELIDHLVHSPDLKVISRTSSFQFKGKNDDIRTIAMKLGVANLLEGSVRKAANQIRITAQLIRAADGVHLWSQTFDRNFDDIFKVQDEISTTVVRALNATLAGAARSDDIERSDPETYNLILKGKYFYSRSNTGDFDRAAALFKEAIKRDPKSALPWSHLAGVYVFQGFARQIPIGEARSKAFDAVHQALSLDPSSAKAHRRLGNILSAYDWDWDAAALEYERAATLDPSGEDGRYAKEELLGITQMKTRQGDELLRMATTEVKLSPLDGSSLSYLASIQSQLGHTSDAAKTYQTLLDVNPGHENARSDYAMVLLMLGKHTEALAEAGRAADGPWKLQAMACVQWASGQRLEADASLHTLERRYAQDATYAIATVHACRHEPDVAFDWLERALTKRDPEIVNLNIDPMFSSLRDDPRFNALLRKLRLLD